jgi:hypothetical protein
MAKVEEKDTCNNYDAKQVSRGGQKASEEFGIKVFVDRLENSDDYVFHASFDSSNMSQEQFLREIERHCKAMVKAYRMYGPWLTGSEHELRYFTIYGCGGREPRGLPRG